MKKYLTNRTLQGLAIVIAYLVCDPHLNNNAPRPHPLIWCIAGGLTMAATTLWCGRALHSIARRIAEEHEQ